MSDPKQNIPLSQLLNQGNAQNPNTRLSSIRNIQPTPTKLQFAPNVNVASQRIEQPEQPKEKTKIKVKPALHGDGGLGFGPSISVPAIDVPEQKEKEKTLLLNPELDFDPCNPNHPITLPLTDPEEKLKEIKAMEEDNPLVKSAEQTIDKEKTYYTPLETIEENPDFLNKPMFNEQGLLYDEYFVMQIPSVLPQRKKRIDPEEEEKEKPKEKKEDDRKIENPLNGMCGYIGKIQYHKSGRATMTIGGVTYTLIKGNKPHFLEEASILSTSKQSLYRLGSISQHVVMVPELDECLSNL